MAKPLTLSKGNTDTVGAALENRA